MQINDNLEAMAKQLYDYWFVQFDFPNEEGKPYKSSGGAMVWNDKLKREIPQGWDFCVLEDLLTIRNGRDHKHLADGIYPVYGSGGEMRKVSEYLYDGESVLMPRKGSLNNIMYVNEAFWTVDTMFYSEMKLSNCAKYIYYTIKDIDFTRWDSGTGVPSMTSSTLYSIKLVKPQNETLKKFDEMISPLFEHMKQISEQNVVLTKQRDELLPLLMNGQASVNYHLSAKVYPLPIAYKKAMPIVANQIISSTFIQKSNNHIPSQFLHNVYKLRKFVAHELLSWLIVLQRVFSKVPFLLECSHSSQG